MKTVFYDDFGEIKPDFRLNEGELPGRTTLEAV